MTNRSLIVVTTNPASEADLAEFTRWYDEVHIPQLLERVEGFVSAKRYKVSDASPTQPTHRYVAVYEIDSDDPSAAHAALLEALGAGRLDMTTALSPEPGAMVLLQPV